MKEHLIIIGGVAAGTKAAAKARRNNPDLKITLYTEGKYISYSACGMPYYIEDIITDEKKLILRTPGYFKEKENIDILIKHKVVKILPEEHCVEVLNLQTGEHFTDEYSKLLIATGARAFIPDIEGCDLKNVYVLKDIDDAVHIKNAAKTAKNIVIAGGGYIGIELLESFSHFNKNITMLERTSQILNNFDEDVASNISNYLTQEKNIRIITDNGIKRIIGDENGVVKQIETDNGESLDSDLVILAIGVRPNIELAEDAGIKIGETGAIEVDFCMETSIPDIYAAGDCVETTNMITGHKVWIPLGSTANKTGRVAAINITGGHEEFKGVLGSMICRAFDFNIGKTGLGEKEAKKLGLDYVLAILTHKDKSGYMPGSQEITIKMLADKKTEKLMGVQIIGKGNVDKPLNVIATALTAGMTVEEFMQTDLSYAPPFSSSVDALLVAAQILYGKLKKSVESVSPAELKNCVKTGEMCKIIDIRTTGEFVKWHIEEAENMTVEEIEQKLADSPQRIIICCNSGMESYISAQKLQEKGYKNVKFVDGGTNFLQKCNCKKQ